MCLTTITTFSTSAHRIEETWRLWQKFLDDFSRFEDWLKISERTAALPSSSGVLYTVAKEELKKFEVISLLYKTKIRDNKNTTIL